MAALSTGDDVLRQQNQISFVRIEDLDTCLFLNDLGLSPFIQDKIRRTFLDTPQKIEKPQNIPSTKEKKPKPMTTSETKAEQIDDKNKSETTDMSREKSDVVEKINKNPREEEQVVKNEKETAEESVRVENQDEKGKNFETVCDVKPEIPLKEESKEQDPRIEIDSSIPKSWSLKIHDDGRKTLVSPSGDLFSTRRLALKHMMESKESSKEDLEEMRTCLVHEGWKTDSMLPLGWMKKAVKGKEIVLLSDGMKQFGMKTAIASMEKSGRFSKNVIDGLKEMQKSHQGREEEAKHIKTDEVETEKTNVSEVKAIKAEEVKEGEMAVDEKVKEKEIREKVKTEEVKEEKEVAKKETGIEAKGNPAANQEDLHSNLPPGWTVSQTKVLPLFTLQRIIISTRLPDQMVKCSQAGGMLLHL